MLRALVFEGVATAVRALYAVRFHGWRVRVWRCVVSGCAVDVCVEILCPHGDLWDRVHWGEDHRCTCGVMSWR